MNRLNIKKSVFILINFFLILSACNESHPTRENFAWSPDGNWLALVTEESQELLLARIGSGQISSIKLLDSCNHFPSWSADGKFILYSQSDDKGFRIRVYNVDQDRSTTIWQIHFAQKNEQANIVLPQLSPVKNEILICNWKQGELLLSDMKGGNRRTILHFSKKVNATWAPDGTAILFSRYFNNNSSQNGIWKVSSNGGSPEKIYPADDVINFQASPDGRWFALKEVYQKIESVHNNVPVKKRAFRLLLVSVDGVTHQELTCQDSSEIRFYWSADSRKVVYQEQDNDEKNIRLFDRETGENLKLTMEDAEEICGWGDADKLFFTKKIPDKLIKLTRQQEQLQEFKTDFMQDVVENRLVVLDKNRIKEGDSNVYGANYYAPRGYLAYFKKFSSGFFKSTLYCPVVELSEQNKIYLPRTRDEKLAVADCQYLARNYSAALELLGQMAGFDMMSADAVQKFDPGRMFAAEKDSVKLREFWDDVASKVLLRAALALRKLDKPVLAESLLEKYRQFCHIYLAGANSDSKAREKISDEIFWDGIYIYSHLGEAAAGISDFAALKSEVQTDSVANACVVLAQAFFANSSNHPKQALDFIKALFQVMPKKGNDLDDLWSMAAMVFFNPSNFKQPEFEHYSNLLAQKLSNSDMSDIGDLYLELQDKSDAFKMYQLAVTRQFDANKIWEKIFDLNQVRVEYDR